MNATRASQLNGKRRHGPRAGRDRKSAHWQFLRGFLKHPVMVGSVIPSSRILIDRMLKPVDWSATKLFVEYGPGVGTFTRPILEKLGPDAKLIAIDTNPDFIDYLNGDIDDERFVAVHGSAAEVEKIIAEHGFDHADYILSGLPFSTLPPGVGEAIGAATGLVTTAFAGDLYGIVLGFGLASLGFGFTRPGFTAGASLAVPLAEQGGVAGVVTAANGSAYVLAPGVGMLLYAADPHWPFVVGAALLIGLLLWSRGRLAAPV